ncbi:MAG: hypothetical protein U0559_09085 [Anaerolineae bacterium]
MSITELWPGIVVLVGLMFWGGYLFGGRHDPGLAFVGTIAFKVGLFFFLFTLHINVPGFGPIGWGRLWPAFPLIVGIARRVVADRPYARYGPVDSSDDLGCS